MVYIPRRPRFPYILIIDPATATRGTLRSILTVPGAEPLLVYADPTFQLIRVAGVATMPATRFQFGHPDDGVVPTLEGHDGLARATSELATYAQRVQEARAEAEGAALELGTDPRAFAGEPGSWPGRLPPLHPETDLTLEPPPTGPTPTYPWETP